MKVEEAPHERAGDVVGEVPHHATSPRHESREVDLQGVPVDDRDVRRRALAELGGQPGIQLDRDHSVGSLRQGKRERTGARADLQERLVGPRTDRLQQLLDGRGAEEVLAQPAWHGRSLHRRYRKFSIMNRSALLSERLV